MSKRLYVGNLPYSADNDSLRELFGAHGTVTDVHVASDRETGRSRGFGFVSFETEAEALAAVQALNGVSIGGRPLAVNVARERGSAPPPRPASTGRPPTGRPPARSGGSHSGPPPSRGGMPPDGPPAEEEEQRRVRRTEPRLRRKPIRERDRTPRPKLPEEDEQRGGAGSWRKWLSDPDREGGEGEEE